MKFCEKNQLVVGAVPYDMDGGAVSGDFVSLRNYRHVAVILIKDAGDESEDPVLTVEQATAVAGTSAKALNFTEYAAKSGTLTAIGTFTKTTQSAANTLTGVGENQEIIVVEFDAEDLDVDNGFDCLRASLSDPGSGTGAYGTILYVLSEPRYAEDTMPSGIVD